MKRFSVVPAVLTLVTAAFALDAPYLIEATARNSIDIMLSWRNNSTAYTMIMVLRKTDGDDAFGLLSTAAGNASSYLDRSPAPAVSYTYALVAVAGTDTSDTSNTVTAARSPCETTLESWDTEEMGSIIQLWRLTWDNDLKRLGIEYSDDVCDEQGVVVYRDDGDSAYRLIDTVFHADPFDTSRHIWFDTACLSNRIYRYKLALFNGTLLVWQRGEIDYTFTYDPEAMFVTDRSRISTVEKLGEVPVYYSDSGTWAMKTGDTLLVKESNTDSVTFTRIDVGDPSHPAFIDYRHSGPVVTATSVCFADGAGLFVYSGSDSTGSLIYYSSGAGGIEAKDTLTGEVAAVAGRINDSTLITGCDYVRMVTFDENGYVSTSSPVKYLHSGKNIDYRVLGVTDSFLFMEMHLYANPSLGGLSGDVLIFSGDRDRPIVCDLPYYPLNLPFMIGGHIATDSVLTNARHVLLDTLNEHAYVFGRDDVLRIYSFRLDPADIGDLVAARNRPVRRAGAGRGRAAVITDYRQLAWPAAAVIYDIAGRVVFRGEVLSAGAFRLLAGRLRPGVYAVHAGDADAASGRRAVFTLHNYHYQP